jgi:hypothetical protein
MRMGRLRTRKTRLWAVACLLPALALRVLVPVGFMPVFGAGEPFTMQMCHGSGPVPAASQPLPDGGAPASDGRGHHAPCPFAATGTAAPPSAIVVSLPDTSAPEPAAATAGHVVILRTTHEPQSPRAPPAVI